MHSVTVKRKIPAASAKVWEAIDDFGHIFAFNPFVDSSPILNGVASGTGAERACHFYDGNTILEKVTDYAMGQGYTIEITDPGAFPLKKASARLELTPQNTNSTNVDFTMNFLPKYGPIGWLLAKLFMKAQFRKTLEQVLAGLEEHLRTGRIIGKNGQLLDKIMASSTQNGVLYHEQTAG